MKLSIIIVNYNTGALTKACLNSILSQTVPFRYEILVVDNDSSDESVPFLRSDFPEVSVIANERNRGLAAGVNQGIAASRGAYYLILNPDIIVMPGALTSLVQFMDEHQDTGIAGGKLVSPNGRIQYSCYRFYRPSTVVYRRTPLGKTAWGKHEVDRFLMKDIDRSHVTDVDWLMGACLIVRAAAAKKVGGMDEHFFLYFEDIDWCRRFKEAGWGVMYVPTARFSHYHQRSSATSSLYGILTNRAAWYHIISAMKYFWKYRFRSYAVSGSPATRSH